MSMTYFDRPLQPGDRIGLLGPSGAMREPEWTPEALAARIEAMGFVPVLGDSVGAGHGYLSGTDAVRLADLHRMFANDTVRAIFCVRGGYGASRLLDAVDWPLVRQHPKLLIGYSDVTALHLAIHAHAGFPSLHGPMVSSGALDEPFSRQHCLRAMTCAVPLGTLPLPDGADKLTRVRGGRAEGLLIGGNLSLLAALCGTRHMPDLTGKILFIEDVGEKTYALDRMLTQLRTCGAFAACAGVVFGGFTDCPVEHPDYGLTVEQIIEETVAPFGKPILAGLPCGHLTPTLSLPMGLRCGVDADAGTVTLLEPLFGRA